MFYAPAECGDKNDAAAHRAADPQRHSRAHPRDLLHLRQAEECGGGHRQGGESPQRVRLRRVRDPERCGEGPAIHGRRATGRKCAQV